jgi:glycosyltransferase involved in cell wall biosynthesis
MPPNVRVLSLEEAKSIGGGWHSIICHNVSDLLDAKDLRGPRILMIHGTLDGRMREEPTDLTQAQVQQRLAQYCKLFLVHVVAVSALKGESWGFSEDIVPFSVDIADYPLATGELREGLRVSNNISLRPKILMWEFHQAAFGGLPIKLVGRNPDMVGVEPSRSWAELKALLKARRFFIHTADPRLEDGYNMATIEAMAVGLPILGNRHPTSPIEHGTSGFLSDDPTELRAFAERLLDDRALAMQMGRAARDAVQSRFGVRRFTDGFTAAIERARALYKSQFESRRQSSAKPKRRR